MTRLRQVMLEELQRRNCWFNPCRQGRLQLRFSKGEALVRIADYTALSGPWINSSPLELSRSRGGRCA